MKQLLAINWGEQFWVKPNQGIEGLSQFESIGGLISTILPNLYVLAGLILLFFLIFGGVTVILGSSNNNPEQIEKGKKTLTTTLAGFLVVFVSYWIIQILEIITGIPIL